MSPVNRDTVGRIDSVFGHNMSSTLRSKKEIPKEEPIETY
jgi:hypothetical protein